MEDAVGSGAGSRIGIGSQSGLGSEPESEPGSAPRSEPTREGFGGAGTQTLVSTPANASPLAELPDCAYDNLLIIAVRDHPTKIEARLEREGHDTATVGVVPVVPAAGDYDGDLWTTDPVRPNDLTGLGMRFSDAVRHIESGTGWVLLDALGVLLVYSEESRVCRFFQTLANRVRAHGARGVYCIAPEAVSDGTYERFRSMCDAERDSACASTDST
ncbi:hypothetical protein NGM10_13150 [Halorussus salilacus]|uniref:DUF7504 family protein n=1 Tax=Halorussus salilacus TaxID=2953750 RepID=UPI00209F12BF|nr:hypothetical protein [Halorussus salilacus]USZ67671.1 hypothetical protein NGM10_13150 [Halorussus salilacus]